MMKKLCFLLICCAALLLAGTAAAERLSLPVGGFVPGAQTVPAFRGSGESCSAWLDKTYYNAGDRVVICVDLPEGYTYRVTLGIQDDTFLEPYLGIYTWDVLYSASDLTEPTHTYDLACLPGLYITDVYFCDSEGTTVDVIRNCFHVTTDGSDWLSLEVERVAAECRGADDYETVVNIHNWVLDHCEYDRTLTYKSAESLFRYGKGVCNSYARACHLLMKAAGIPSRRVIGSAYVDDPAYGHAWNAACVDGTWFLFDATWDDNRDIYLDYFFFGLNSALMNLEHYPKNYVGGDAVVCDSLEYNYLLRSGLWTGFIDPTMDRFAEQLAAGRHRFVLSPAEAVGFTRAELAQIVNTIAAEGLSRGTWTDVYGDDCAAAFTAVYGETEITGRLIGRGTLTLPDGLTEIGPEAFAGTAATHVVLGPACAAIGEGAFRGAHVWEIAATDRLTAIDPHAFDGLTGLLIVAPEGSPAAEWAAANGFDTTPDP